MLDPVTALGVAAATVQFISFTSEVISKSREIYHSADGSLVSQNELDTVARSLQRLCKPLRSFEQHRAYTTNELDLKKLCKGCISITEELERDLAKLRVQGSHHRKWKSFRQALNAVRSESTIEQLSARLDRYRSQIDTTLLFILRAEIDQLHAKHDQSTAEISKMLLGSVADNKKWQAEIVENIQKQSWKHDDPVSVEQFSSLLSASTELQRKQMIKADILRRLQFDTMDHREERIPNAYQNTFQWVFEPSLNLDTQQTFDNYVRWLKEDEPLYWITGKPGAGKSTLTKYLFNEVRTRSFAETWARDNRLICAGFFFWNSGGELQMSREGLLRTLLYQVVSSSPEFIPMVFKKSWENYELWGADLCEWSWETLTQCLKELISHARHNYLFFIDGLDEFSGDHSELVDLILQLSKCANVKLCVASRPWLAFEEAFGKRPRLRVETLTRSDIERFVSEKLQASDRFSMLQRDEPVEAKFLIDEVTGKAHGVFLWVYLVVRSLLEGLRDGDSMRELYARIALLPSDLEALFEKILSRLDASYFRQASILFQLMEAAAPRPLTVLCVAFAEDGFSSAMKAPKTELTPGQRASRAETVRRKLNSRSKGLLEATPVKSDPDRAQVQYLHRTVKDFLARPDIWQYILSGTDESFNPSISLCGTYLLHLKTMSVGVWECGNIPTLKDIWGAVRGCLDHASRAEGTLAHKQVAFYDQMDMAVMNLFDKSQKKTTDRIHWTNSCVNVLSSKQECKAYINSRTCDSFVEFAFHYGLHYYIETKLTKGDLTINHRLKGRSLLHHAIESNDERMVRFLLQQKADPNLADLNEASSTPWQEALRQLDMSYQKDTEKWYDLIQLFVEHGADLEAIVYDNRHAMAQHTGAKTIRAIEVIEISFGAWDFSRMKRLLQRLAKRKDISPSAANRFRRLNAQKQPCVATMSTSILGFNFWPATDDWIVNYRRQDSFL